MQEALLKTGLTELQIAAYLFMLENGRTTPPALAKQLNLTRTNAYKLLNKLESLGLVKKNRVLKKYTYYSEDPMVLASLVAEQRNKVIAMEKDISLVINDLRRKYKNSKAKTSIETLNGKNSIKAAFEQQADLKQPIYFVQSRFDRLAMGFENMDYIRKLAAQHNVPRFGITPDAPEAPTTPSIDIKTNLVRTWMKMEDYTSPVEWTVSGSELMLVIYNDNPRIIKINDLVVATAFTEIWKLLDSNIRSNPGYKKLPKKAKRAI